MKNEKLKIPAYRNAGARLAELANAILIHDNFEPR
jgi:hypothetical protein